MFHAFGVVICWWFCALSDSTYYGFPFCGPNVFDHFMCDMYPLLKLIRTDTYVIGILVVANGGLICTIVFLLLLISYGVILHSLKNLSQEGRQKAFQTCGSHITVVICFFVPCIFMYERPAKTFPIDKSLSVFYIVITPMLSPLIYSLRNSELSNAMKKLFRKKISYQVVNICIIQQEGSNSLLGPIFLECKYLQKSDASLPFL